MGSHTGTHIDAPYHFIEDGKTIDELPISTLVGPALVVSLPGLKPRQQIVWDDLQQCAPDMKPDVIVLIHTGWDRHWCSPKYLEHPFLSKDAAQCIISTGVRVVGIDTLSPDETPDGPGGFGAHEAILGAGGVICENLTNLGSLLDARYNVSLLPLNIKGSDGAPVRAFAWSQTD